MECLCSSDKNKNVYYDNNLKLMPILNSFNNAIEINNFLIKKKIRRKIDIIINMKYYGFPIMNYENNYCKSILEKLYNIDKNKKILVYSDEVNKLLGNIVNNIFEYSGYQVLLFNVPEYSITREDDKLQKIDCENIYDTMIYYSGDNTVLNVIQVSSSSYLIQFVDDKFAIYICDLLHNNMMGKNIIKVEYVKIRCYNTENMENTEHMKHMENMENMKHMEHMENMENTEHMKHMENMENMKHMEHMENMENTEHMKHMENMENMKHMEHMKHKYNLLKNQYIGLYNFVHRIYNYLISLFISKTY